MDRTIVVSSALRERFKTAWGQRQIIFFSAPCGFGKSAAASASLEGYKVCRWDAIGPGTAERPADVSCDAVLMDNLQMLKSPEAQQDLCEIIREHPKTHFVLFSWGAVPGWLMPFRYEPRMQVFETKDLMLDRETAEKLLDLHGSRLRRRSLRHSTKRRQIGVDDHEYP